MTFDPMPEEPGDQLTEAYPGFTDRLMQRIEAHERRQRHRRVAAAVLTMACVAAGGYMLSTRPGDPVQRPALARRRPVPAAMPAATPAVKPAPVQQAASPRERRKPHTALPHTAAQGQPAAAPSQAATQPEEVVITLDGKVLHGVKLENGLVKCTSQGVRLVRDEKPGTATTSSTGREPCKSGSQ